jgi:hypothetical protein
LHSARVFASLGVTEFICEAKGCSFRILNDTLDIPKTEKDMLKDWNEHIPHKDKVGNDIHKGMWACYLRNTSTSATILHSRVSRTTDHMVIFENGDKAKPYRIVVPIGVDGKPNSMLE